MWIGDSRDGFRTLDSDADSDPDVEPSCTRSVLDLDVISVLANSHSHSRWSRHTSGLLGPGEQVSALRNEHLLTHLISVMS